MPLLKEPCLPGKNPAPFGPQRAPPGKKRGTGLSPRPGTESLPFFPPCGAFLPPAPGAAPPPCPERPAQGGAERLCPPPKKMPAPFRKRGKSRSLSPQERKKRKKSPPPCLTWEKGEGRALLRGFFPPAPSREGRDAHKGAFSPPQGLLNADAARRFSRFL